jgi:hypothetical protein
MFSTLSILILAAVVALVSAQKTDFECPASKSPVHASCQVYTVFEDPCTTVQSEMMWRVNGQATGAWRDPHNNGNYSAISTPNGLPSTWEFSRTTGDGKYTDLINYAFYLYNENSCQVYACSESQVFSIGDYGTNYCNIHDLYCDEVGCQPHYKLFYDEEIKKCTQADQELCTPKA